MNRKPEFWEWIDFSYFAYKEWLDGTPIWSILTDYGAEAHGVSWFSFTDGILFWARLAEKGAELLKRARDGDQTAKAHWQRLNKAIAGDGMIDL